MARSNESYRLGYGATDYNPSSERGAVSIGRVGDSVRDYSSPGRSFGSGVGATLSLPVGKNVKSKAKGGMAKMASGGSASKRADGIATKGKTRGKMC